MDSLYPDKDCTTRTQCRATTLVCAQSTLHRLERLFAPPFWEYAPAVLVCAVTGKWHLELLGTTTLAPQTLAEQAHARFSKYHYVSLRPAISTEAHRLNAYGDSSGQLHIAPQDGDFSTDNDAGDQEILTDDDTEEDDDDDLGDLSE